jgi:hypothetical protein
MFTAPRLVHFVGQLWVDDAVMTTSHDLRVVSKQKAVFLFVIVNRPKQNVCCRYVISLVH